MSEGLPWLIWHNCENHMHFSYITKKPKMVESQNMFQLEDSLPPFSLSLSLALKLGHMRLVTKTYQLWHLQDWMMIYMCCQHLKAFDMRCCPQLEHELCDHGNWPSTCCFGQMAYTLLSTNELQTSCSLSTQCKHTDLYLSLLQWYLQTCNHWVLNF